MFNIFSTPTRTESGNLYPSWSWTTSISIKDADGKDVPVADLISKYNEAMKEIKNLNQLKEENVQLIERVNEIDSDVNRDLQDQLFTLKNDYAVLKAKYQILNHNYQGCTKYRDEYKHQLNAANKENEELKKRIDGLSLAIDRKNFEVDECKTSFENMRKAYEQEAKSANKELEKRLELEKEYEVRLKELNNGLVDVTRENKKFCKIIEDQKAEIEKLKKDIVDYVFEKDEQKHPMYPLHWGGYEPEKWSTTKVAVDDAVQAKLREVYGIEEKKTFKPWVEEPIDWKGEEVEFNAKELLKRVTECAESLPVSLPNELQKDKEWICPCNMCKHAREENTEKSWEQTASDLALRVVKLEKKVEELIIIKHTSDPNYKYFLKHGRWPYNNKAKE